MAEKRSLPNRPELFRSERQWLDRESELEILGDVEYPLHAIPSRSLEVGDDQEVDIAQRVRVSSRHTAEKKNSERVNLLADSLD